MNIYYPDHSTVVALEWFLVVAYQLHFEPSTVIDLVEMLYAGCTNSREPLNLPVDM